MPHPWVLGRRGHVRAGTPGHRRAPPRGLAAAGLVAADIDDEAPFVELGPRLDHRRHLDPEAEHALPAVALRDAGLQPPDGRRPRGPPRRAARWRGEARPAAVVAAPEPEAVPGPGRSPRAFGRRVRGDHARRLAAGQPRQGAGARRGRTGRRGALRRAGARLDLRRHLDQSPQHAPSALAVRDHGLRASDHQRPGAVSDAGARRRSPRRGDGRTAESAPGAAATGCEAAAEPDPVLGDGARRRVRVRARARRGGGA